MQLKLLSIVAVAARLRYLAAAVSRATRERLGSSISGLENSRFLALR